MLGGPVFQTLDEPRGKDIMTDYKWITITRDGGCATIQFTSPILKHNKDGSPIKPSSQRELAVALHELRFDKEVRVVVVTGKDDIFFSPGPTHPNFAGHTPDKTWDGLQSIHFTLQQLIETEKPVIAKVNGTVMGWGTSFVFGCDFILARDDAVFADHHLGMGDGNPPVGRPGAGIVPGDGGSIFVPLHMTPALAREYLWLGRQFTGKELFERGCISAATPAADLDATCDQMVDALLRRPPYALAFSKRTFNRVVADRFNLLFDIGYSYEMMNKEQHDRYVDGRGETTL